MMSLREGEAAELLSGFRESQRGAAALLLLDATTTPYPLLFSCLVLRKSPNLCKDKNEFKHVEEGDGFNVLAAAMMGLV